MSDSTIGAIFRAQNLAVARGGDQIYHYCSIDSLIAILNSSSVRFGALPYMNDPEEHRFGLNFIAKVCLDFFWEHGEWSDFSLEEVYEDFRGAFRNILLDTYVFCLSQEGDRLSLWRAYGSDGEGCSIEFSKTRLLSLPTRGEVFSYFVTPVVYTERKREIIRNGMFADIRKVLTEFSDTPDPIEFAPKLLPYVAFLPLTLKAYEYSEEYEWRLIVKINRALRKSVSSPVYEVDGRPRVSIPLLELTGATGVTKVILGPVSSTKLKSIQDQLDRQLASDVNPPKLTASQIAYRNAIRI